MNKPIRTMAVFCMLLFLALLLNATYLQYISAGSLNDRSDNRRVRDAEFSRKRGAILVDGKPVAESVPVDDQFKYQRRYPTPLRYAHVTGFFSYIYGATGVESSQNQILSGSDPRLFVNRLVDIVSNTPPEGGSVSLTIDPAAQTGGVRRDPGARSRHPGGGRGPRALAPARSSRWCRTRPTTPT